MFANALALGEKPQEVILTRGTCGYTSGNEMKSTLKKSLSTESAEFSYMHCCTPNFVLVLTQMYHGFAMGVCGTCTCILLFSRSHCFFIHFQALKALEEESRFFKWKMFQGLKFYR